MTRGQQIAKEVRRKIRNEKIAGAFIDLTIVAIIVGVVIVVGETLIW